MITSEYPRIILHRFLMSILWAKSLELRKPTTANTVPCCIHWEYQSSPGARFPNVFFARNSNWMETSPCHNSVAGHQIATNFCTCHDSTAVVQCTKFCSKHYIRIEVRVKWNFHRIWIAMEKPLVKRGPVQRHTAPTIGIKFHITG